MKFSAIFFMASGTFQPIIFRPIFYRDYDFRRLSQKSNTIVKQWTESQKCEKICPNLWKFLAIRSPMDRIDLLLCLFTSVHSAHQQPFSSPLHFCTKLEKITLKRLILTNFLSLKSAFFKFAL